MKSASSKKPVDLSLVQDVAEFMKSHDLGEIEIKFGSYEIKLKKNSSGHTQNGYSVPTQFIAAPSATTANLAAPAPVVANQKKYHVISSPFVGTFYRSAGPNQDPFVEVGQIVAAGDPLCIVEAMKLMNEIESDIKGRIVRVLVDNATPVEFGEALFEVEGV